MTPTDASLVPDSVADPSARIGLGRLFTSPGVDPYDEVVWERRDARITNSLDGTVAFEQPAVEFPADWSLNATNIVAQKYFRGTLGTARPRVVAAPGRRPGRRHDHPLGRRGRLLRRRRRVRRVHRRAEVHARHPAGGVQQPGVVQHRRRGRSAAGGRRASSSRSTTRWTRSSTGTARRGSSSRAAPAPAPTCRTSARAPKELLNGGGTASGPVSFMRGADASAGTIKSGGKTRRAAKMVDPRRRPPGRRGVHLVQGRRGAQGPRPARRRLRHGPRRPRLVLGAVPERQQLGAGHRRVHAGGRRRRRLGARARSTTGEVVAHRPGARPVAPDRRGRVGVRRPRHAVRHHDQPLAHGGEHRVASTPAIRASLATRWCTPTRG